LRGELVECSAAVAPGEDRKPETPSGARSQPPGPLGFRLPLKPASHAPSTGDTAALTGHCSATLPTPRGDPPPWGSEGALAPRLQRISSPARLMFSVTPRVGPGGWSRSVTRAHW
jgi:hypothetical protein